MASNSETGHVINNANFKKMIDFCTAYGVPYNPTNVRIILANMTTLWTTADTAQTTLTAALQNSRIPINNRRALFRPFDKLITRVNNVFQGMDMDKDLKKSVKSLADEIRGTKKNALPPEGVEGHINDPAGISESHQSYVQKTSHFKGLIELLTTAGYAPNETDINLGALTNLYDSMKAANDNIGTIIAPVKNAMAKRDHALYDENTGIFDVQKECKKYVKGVFGATSEEAKQVTRLKFTEKKI